MQKINAEDKCILGGCKRFAVVSTNKSLFEKKIMQFINSYNSPLGKLIMASDGESLTGLWFCGQKYCELYLDKEHEEKDLHIFDMTKKWLDMYFSGREPDFELPHKFVGSRFQNEVWEILCSIPYGKTVTYGDIAITPKGESYAANVLRRHRLIKQFLINELGVDEKIAEHDACQMEHVMSPVTIDKLYEYLERQV